MDDYMVIYKNLPCSVHAFTMYNACDNYYTIVLNSKIAYNTAPKAFLHEIHHINNRDFDIGKQVDQIEAETHVYY